MALEGRSVLLMDLDSQSNLSMHLLGESGDAVTPGKNSSFELRVDKMPLADGLCRLGDEGLWVLPGSQDLAGIGVILKGCECGAGFALSIVGHIGDAAYKSVASATQIQGLSPVHTSAGPVVLGAPQ